MLRYQHRCFNGDGGQKLYQLQSNYQATRCFHLHYTNAHSVHISFGRI